MGLKGLKRLKGLRVRAWGLESNANLEDLEAPEVGAHWLSWELLPPRKLSQFALSTPKTSKKTEK